MIKKIKKLNVWFDTNALMLSVWLAIILSIGSFLFFYFNGHWNLAYYDALSHLNMGRKIFDNLTPGFAQLGGLWLPLTHILISLFAWNNFLWQSGIAGALVSMPIFVLSVYFIFKIIDLLFEDKKSAFLGALVYMTNINMLYLQTMAMMEPLFNLTIIGGIYFISKWAKKDNILDLIIGGIFIMASTLTRYEGYGIFAMAALSVIIITFWKNRKNIKRKIIEGNFLLFIVIASLGIVLWSGYLGVIFGDPLHWLHPNNEVTNLGTQEMSSVENSSAAKGVRLNYYKSFSKSAEFLWWAVVNANGVIVSIISIAGFLIAIFYLFRSRHEIKNYQYVPALLISSSVFLFLFSVMYIGKTSVWAPMLWGSIFDRSLNYFDEAGIRYTLALLPFVAIFSSVVSLGKWYKKVLLLFFIIFQVSTVFIGPFFLTYNLSLKWRSVYANEIKSTNWMKHNYDEGLILCSAIAHETEMFKNAIVYKKYIHEGAGKYWTESLKNPAKYATWIIMNKQVKSGTSGVWGTDVITKNLADSEILQDKFNLVYEDESAQIYKIKDKPEIDLLEKLGKK